MTGQAAHGQATFSVVVPTVGRPSLLRLLRVLQEQLPALSTPEPVRVVVVDDRRGAQAPLSPRLGLPGLHVLGSGGRGPAAARNTGWRACSTPWVAFLDDDVLPSDGWAEQLLQDLASAPESCAGVQGRVQVPLPEGRRPTDWERSTAGLADARWITADMAYRHDVLARLGGFDERFPRAYREDVDLAVRVQDAGWQLQVGRRAVVHPVRPVDRWVSVRVQKGNADDVLMRRLHGPDWRSRAGAPPGRRPRHLAVTAAGVAAVALAPTGHRRAATAGAAAWLAGTAELTVARVRPGPRTLDEVLTMAATSVAIPPAATVHWLRGLVRHARARPWSTPARAVLFDRDGTLVHDVPYNGDPSAVRPAEGAREAVERLRRAGVRVGVVTNQSGIARGLLDEEQVRAVNRRVDELLGPFDTWQHCPHGEDDGCRCRKPAPGMVEAAARQLGLRPQDCVVIGDIGADVGAAAAAGARSVLVPTPATRPEEVAAAPVRARSLTAAVDLVLGGLV